MNWIKFTQGRIKDGLFLRVDELLSSTKSREFLE
jgi:hypothetical protein